MKRIIALGIALVLASAGAALAQGMLIPKDTSLPPLSIKSHRVNVEVRSQVATTDVVQVFQNNTDRRLEATYIFPLPPGATISDFAMYINGKRVSGELVEKEKARQVYTQIVRRIKDPGLLEYIDCNLLRMNVFPIQPNGAQKLEVRYSEVLRRDSGMCHYVYPLKTEGPASRTLDDFTFSMDIHSKDPITNVYSPSHEMGKTQKDEHEVIVGFEKGQALLDRDVEVYYAVSDKAFGMNLLTCRGDKTKDGYFMLLITPRYAFKEQDILPRDVVFVLDTSGSMANDNRLTQAKEALKYCINSLKDTDRFDVVGFSTTTNPLSDALLNVNKENRERALAFVDKQEAMGGTAIEAALKKALSMRPETEKGRPFIVVFLTDGRPTIGIDDTDALVKIAAPADHLTRIFTWGVGTDVNTHLLDRIAQETRAVSAYVTPGEKIETKVSLFFNKLSKPVMANPTIDWGKMKVHDVHPAEVPDLFVGQQVAMFGRYEGSGDVAVTLKGKVASRDDSQTFEGTLGQGAGNAFVEKLWAGRHIGFMLDEIRLHGEKKELKDDIIRLSRTYGIQTPYTSYLILDSEQAYKQHGITRGVPWSHINRYPDNRDERNDRLRRDEPGEAAGRTGGDALGRAQRPADTTTPAAPAPSAGKVREELRRREARSGVPTTQAGAVEGDRASRPGYYDKGEVERAAADAKKALKDDTGVDAVELAKEVARLKARVADVPAGANEKLADGRGGVSRVRRAAGRTFTLFGGFWVDEEFDAKKNPLVEVKYLSDAYFALLKAFPELKAPLALGERVIVVVGGNAIAVQAEGRDKLTDGELKLLKEGKPLPKAK